MKGDGNAKGMDDYVINLIRVDKLVRALNQCRAW